MMSRVLTLFLLVLVTGCVPSVNIAGAPCPCPQGYECCDTQNACIVEGGECPPVYPASSGMSCTTDSYCYLNEVCHIWTTDDQLSGPSTCRRECPGPYPCGEGEACRLIPHNAQSLEIVNVIWACVPETQEAGCEEHGCGEWAKQRIGKTFCEDENVHSCLFAFHHQCGLTCKSVLIQDCENNGCLEEESGVPTRCEHYGWEDPCVTYDCSACGENIGGFFCQGSDLIACVSMSIETVYCGGGSCSCEDICNLEIIQQDSPSCQ